MGISAYKIKFFLKYIKNGNRNKINNKKWIDRTEILKYIYSFKKWTNRTNQKNNTIIPIEKYIEIDSIDTRLPYV